MRLRGLALTALLMAAAPLAAQRPPVTLPAPPPTPGAQPADQLDDYLSRWQQSMEQVQSLSATLKRTEKDPVTEVESHFTGVTKYLKAGNGPGTQNLALLEMTPEGKKEFSERFVCSGAFLYQFLPGPKEIVAHELPKPKAGQVADDNLLSFLFGMKKEEAKSRYELKLTKVTNDYVYVEVIPRNAADKVDFKRRKSSSSRTRCCRGGSGSSSPTAPKPPGTCYRSTPTTGPSTAANSTPRRRRRGGRWSTPPRTPSRRRAWPGPAATDAERHGRHGRAGDSWASPPPVFFPVPRKKSAARGTAPVVRGFISYSPPLLSPTWRSLTMRSVCANLLTAGLFVLVASPAFAQPPGNRGMRQPPTAASLLRSDKVKTELKLTDEEKDKITKITDKYKDDLATARSSRDRDKTQADKSMNADLEKALPTILNADQTKRLNQLVVQASGLDAFSKEDVKSALKLTDKQSKEIEDQKAQVTKDAEDLMKDVGTDRQKRREAGQKVQALRKDAMDKVLASFTDEQKKEWNDLTGEKFTFDFGRQGGRRPRTTNNQ